MNIDGITNTVANARSWVGNFAGPCLWLAGLAFLAGCGVSGWAAWKIQDGRVARAEATLATLKADLATSANRTIADNADRERQNMATLMQSMSSLTARVDAIPVRLQPSIDKTNATLRGLLNATDYNCLSLPLPVDALRLLQQPGGNAAAGVDTH